MDFNAILKEGCFIKSSGTTGDPKTIYRSPKNLDACNAAALLAQKITKNSRIYTCCKMTHAGGLLAQTLPAVSIGAKVDIVEFNAYQFLKDVKNYTHTHITPLHAKAIMMTKSFKNINLSGLWVTCGSDPVSWNIIEAFVTRGCTFMANWGMSEIGPIAINVVFNNIDDVNRYKKLTPPSTTILGDNFYCDWKVENNKLFVRGTTCIYDDWFETGDVVNTCSNNSTLFYAGRNLT